MKLTSWLTPWSPVQCWRPLFPASFASSASRKNIYICNTWVRKVMEFLFEHSIIISIVISIKSVWIVILYQQRSTSEIFSLSLANLLWITLKVPPRTKQWWLQWAISFNIHNPLLRYSTLHFNFSLRKVNFLLPKKGRSKCQHTYPFRDKIGPCQNRI